MNQKDYLRALNQCKGKHVLFAYIDLFCGAGGVSVGIANSKYSVVVACANHDETAIASHKANHKDAIHFTEDIRMLNLDIIVRLVNDIRRLYPHIKIVLWASCECTHFSKAKGGDSRDADSRTLAKSLNMVYDPDHTDNEDGFRIGDSYIQKIKPDYIQIENVVEFKTWGPLTAKVDKIKINESKTRVQVCHIKFDEKLGKFQPEKWVPEDKTKGKDFVQWNNEIDSLGYRNEWRELNAANYGAFTSRNRLFGIFAKGDLPILWPEPTHAKVARVADLFNPGLKKWMPVRDCIDFSKEGTSIFGRKKPLVPKTLERIYAGLVKFVAKGDTSFLSKYYSGDPESKNISLDGPAGSVTTVDSQALVTVDPWIMNYYSGADACRNKSLDDPCNVVRTENCQYLVSPEFLMASNGEHPSSKVFSTDQPCRVITASDNKALVVPEYLLKFNRGEDFKSLDSSAPTITTKDKLGLIMMKYHGRSENLLNPDDPCSTLTTKDRVATIFLDQQYGSSKPASVDEPVGSLTINPKFAACFIDRNFTSGGGKTVDVDGPIGALMTVPKANLVTCDAWLLTNAFQRTGNSLDEPAPTVVATGTRQHLVETESWIMPTSFDNSGRSVDEPAPTVLANRKHHYLVNPQFNNKGASIDDPMFTLIAKMDKKPPYLVSVDTGAVIIVIYEDESEIMKKIKILMAHYGIYDIKMRMLIIKELKKIQGFPASYVLKGTQTDQKKFIGNAVVSDVVEHWINAMAVPFIKEFLMAA